MSALVSVTNPTEHAPVRPNTAPLCRIFPEDDADDKTPNEDWMDSILKPTPHIGQPNHRTSPHLMAHEEPDTQNADAVLQSGILELINDSFSKEPPSTTQPDQCLVPQQQQQQQSLQQQPGSHQQSIPIPVQWGGGFLYSSVQQQVQSNHQLPAPHHQHHQHHQQHQHPHHHHQHQHHQQQHPHHQPHQHHQHHHHRHQQPHHQRHHHQQHHHHPHHVPSQPPQQWQQQQQQHSGSTSPAPSKMMEQFRREKHGAWELPHLRGYIAEFSKDQEGSRLIQKKLDIAGERQLRDQLNDVFAELLPDVQQLMVDVYGNYVIQKLLEYGTNAQRVRLCQEMKGRIEELTKHKYGCRVVQKVLERATDEGKELVKELSGCVVECIQNLNGNHVIQKCIELIPDDSVFIVESFRGNIPQLATHAYGCRVLQKMLEFSKTHPASPLSKALQLVVEEIIGMVEALVTNQNGNYVIQHVMENGTEDQAWFIIQRLAPRFAEYCCNKHASNVAEKVFVRAPAKMQAEIVHSLIASDQLLNIARDQFGNYVVKRILREAGTELRGRIVLCLRPHIAQLRKVSHGKHIITAIEKHDAETKAGIQPSHPQQQYHHALHLPHHQHQHQHHAPHHPQHHSHHSHHHPAMSQYPTPPQSYHH